MSLRCLLGHKWKIYREGPVLSRIDGKCVGTYHILQCKRCGATKSRQYA